MFRLEDLTLFVRAAALNSFSDAAREVGVQPAQVSSAIKRLESTLAIRLFARSTRSLRLTPEGEVWLPYARQMLDVMHAGLQKIQTPSMLRFAMATPKTRPTLRCRLHRVTDACWWHHRNGLSKTARRKNWMI